MAPLHLEIQQLAENRQVTVQHVAMKKLAHATPRKNNIGLIDLKLKTNFMSHLQMEGTRTNLLAATDRHIIMIYRSFTQNYVLMSDFVNIS